PLANKTQIQHWVKPLFTGMGTDAACACPSIHPAHSLTLFRLRILNMVGENDRSASRYFGWRIQHWNADFEHLPRTQRRISKIHCARANSDNPIASGGDHDDRAASQRRFDGNRVADYPDIDVHGPGGDRFRRHERDARSWIFGWRSAFEGLCPVSPLAGGRDH